MAEPIYGKPRNGKRTVYELVPTNGPTDDKTPIDLDEPPPYGYRYRAVDQVDDDDDKPPKENTAAAIVAAYKRGGITYEQAMAAFDRANVSPAAAEVLMSGVRVTGGGGGGGGGGGRARAPRYPEDVEEAELRNALLRMQVDNFGADKQLATMRMQYDQEQRALDNEYRQVLFAFNKAKDERDFGEQQRQFGLLQKLRERAQDLSERRTDVEERMGYANSARADMTANIGRAESLGYTVGDELGVAPGTLTASERSRQFQQQQSTQDRLTAAAERDRDRADREEAELFGRGVTIRNIENQEGAQEEAVKMARINTALGVAGRRGMPKIARTM